MNILQAKEEIKRTVTVYLRKDEYGESMIPYMKQRPIFMIGAPGIGKTAIVEQVARELDIGLVAYSMTHHTRQSAIGLPYIVPMDIDGEQIRISEYTISEIIASVYKTMWDSGRENGILFLDEINCVSETLAPAILQFLQYKTFGNHALPKGWVIISAGNPTQYNRSVREFDIATKDRLKYIVVEEDYDSWKKYAHDKRVHGSILAFLEVSREWFYSIRATGDGEQFATARGWEDLSYMMKEYEKLDFEIEFPLIHQYITDEDIARKFSVFYDLYQKYRKDYRVEEILEGHWDAAVKDRAKEAAFDERLALVEMIVDMLTGEFAHTLEAQAVLEGVATRLRSIKKQIKENDNGANIVEKLLDTQIHKIDAERQNKQIAKALSDEEDRIFKRGRTVLAEFREMIGKGGSAEKNFAEIKRHFDKMAEQQAEEMDRVGARLEWAFSFFEGVWISGRELSYFMAVLTAGEWSSSFIAQHGSEAYQRHGNEMMFHDVKDVIRASIDMELDEE